MRAPLRKKGNLLLRYAGLLGLLLVMAESVLPEQLPVKPYTIADGLAHDDVNKIVRDSRGFLWFCTADGLSRFDGYRFTNYGVKDGLTQQHVTHLLESRRSGAYWVATQGGGVGRFDPAIRTAEASGGKLFVSHPVGDDQATNIVNVLYEDRGGRIWAGTNGGLFRLDPDEGAGGTFRRVELGGSSGLDRTLEVYALIEDQEGSLWIGTLLGVMRRLPDGRTVHYPLESSPTRIVSAFLLDDEGRLWLGYQNGLLVFKPEPASEVGQGGGLPWRVLSKRGATKTNSRPGPIQMPSAPGEASWYTTADGLPHNNLLALYRSADGRIFIGTRGGGLSVLDGSKRFRNYATPEGLSNTINALAEDHHGNVWAGTQSSGAIKVTSGGLVSYRQADGLGSPDIISIFEDRAGELCVISSKWTINRFDGEGFTAVRLNLPRRVLDSSSGRWAIMQDRAGEWWAATNAGLYRFPRVKRLEELAHAPPLAVYTKRDGLADNYVSRLFEDSRGDIWISSFHPPVMLVRWERATGAFHRYTEADGLPPFNWANVFGEDAAGHLWMALHNGGMARHRHGRFELFAEQDGVPPGVMQGLFRDRAGRLWVATGAGGAARLDDPAQARPRFATYTTEEDLSSNNLCCFAEDDAGHLYIGTAHGIDRLDPTTGRIKNYTTADGLLKSEVTAAYRARSGALWFGTREGVSRLVPEADRPQPPPPVLIGGLRIAGFPHPVFELGETEIAGLLLGPNQNQIQIDFFALSFSVGGLRYQYKLEGVDQNWSTPSNQRTVTASLSPGSYRFLVRSVSNDGVTSERPATISFTILPPVWRRWWFLTLAALLAASVAYALVRHRLARLKALRESENRFRTLAETASDAIITISEQSIVVYVNAAAENIFGHTMKEMVGANLTMLMPEYLRHLHHAGLGRYAETGRKHIAWEAVELPGLHKSGREIPLELSFGEFTKDGRRYFTGIVRDITERRRAEEALRRTREERLVELELVRKRIARDLHDDIGSSLTQISLLSEVVRQRLGRDDSSVTQPLSTIASSSRELVDSMSDIVWAINPQKDQLSDLVQRMRGLASDVFTTCNMKLRFRAPDAEANIRLGANLRREVFLVFKESINNVVKHSGGTEVDIEFRVAPSSLFLSVSDDGRGFDLSEESDGHGLVSMRERTREMGGTLDMTSHVGSGTTITMQVPMTDQV